AAISLLILKSFFIVKSNEINAFAGPGGYIGVNTELITASENESELAAVMAHEMAHVRQHHLYRMLEHQKQMKAPMLASILAAIALGAVNPSLGSGALAATLGGFAQDNISFVRSNEKEADRIGIDMLIKSGLDPRGMSSFFKKMQQTTRYYYTANVPVILRSHPLDDDRIAEADNRCANLPQHSVQDNLDYQLFKELIRSSVASNNKQLIDYYALECKRTKTPQTVCSYGLALAYIHVNQYDHAKQAIEPLFTANPNNLYYGITLTQAEIGLGQAQDAIHQLETLKINYPDNYAILFALADAYSAANQKEKAASILLKTSRQYPRDLAVCEALARAEADNHRKNYAYFTEAQCHLLQGQPKEALRSLKLAQTLSAKDPYLKARIDAKIDEIKN
ncbi:MAG: M48 family metalloprotease, partial [Legionellaceae bacterium]